MQITGIEVVQANITGIFERRKAAMSALCLFYAAKVEAELHRRQSGNKYWTNRTHQALDRSFGNAFSESGGTIVGFFLAHGVQYGAYLEFARNGQNAAIWKVMKDFVKPFLADVAKIYGLQPEALRVVE